MHVGIDKAGGDEHGGQVNDLKPFGRLAVPRMQGGDRLDSGAVHQHRHLL
ncbi:hypothetical protein SDC9_178304 [bioreactor metagenome]|uniref:Uncharacterized protein n=1 Tax=bioreactor metagenome TaxID=1076179 RepID=A0A645H4R9_9ZZZZ